MQIKADCNFDFKKFKKLAGSKPSDKKARIGAVAIIAWAMS
jgi:hypothetical protein